MSANAPESWMHVQPVVRDRAVARAADRDRLHLGPSVTEAHHRLAAGLGPAHRALEALAELAEGDLLRVGPDLGAEAAADVGRADPDLVGLQLVAGDVDALDALGVLRRHPLVEPPVDPRRRRAAHLERARGDALVDELPGRRDLAVGEELVAGEVGSAERRRVEHDVAAGGLVEVDGGAQRLLGVDDRVEDVVVDDHGLGGVRGLRAGLGDDGGDRLADVADPVAGEDRAGDGRVERRRRRARDRGRPR